MYIKINSLKLLGIIGGQQAEEILKKAMQASGAMELAQKWIDSESIIKLFGNKDEVISDIQGEAIFGLVFLQKEETDEIVNQAYSLEISKSTTFDDTTSLCTTLISAMQIKDYIKEHGLKTYLTTPRSEREIDRLKYQPQWKIEMINRINQLIDKGEKRIRKEAINVDVEGGR